MTALPEREQLVINDQPPELTWASVSHYLGTRALTLIPTRANWEATKHTVNPIPTLRQLTRRNWAFYGCAMCAWTWDAFDFFAVLLNALALAESFDVLVKDITWGITLVLMLRLVGAIGFGAWGDRVGGKWPLITTLLLLIVVQIGTGFVKTYKEFLGVRAVFGIVMGGIYGNAALCALDDCPIDAKGVVLGMFQEAYALGYLLAVVFQRAIVDNLSHGWRSIFWFLAGPPVLFIAWRAYLPQTDAFILKKALERQSDATGSLFWQNAKALFRAHWLMFIYLVVLMAGFNFMLHGLQDLYPTLLTKQLHYGADRLTVTNSVANLGAIAGGVIIGHALTFVGRRLLIIVSCILGGAMIYPWAFTRNSGINAGAFFLQFFVQGAWGVVPAYISSLSDPRWRAFIVGTSYQLGNLASLALSTIEATIGERFPIYDAHGNKKDGVYNYSKVMAIFMGCVFGFLTIVTFLGPELNEVARGNQERALAELEEKADAEHKLIADSVRELVDESVHGLV